MSGNQKTGLRVAVFALIAAMLIILRDVLIGEERIWIGPKSFAGLVLCGVIFLYAVLKMVRPSQCHGRTDRGETPFNDSLT